MSTNQLASGPEEHIHERIAAINTAMVHAYWLVDRKSVVPAEEAPR